MLQVRGADKKLSEEQRHRLAQVLWTCGFTPVPNRPGEFNRTAKAEERMCTPSFISHMRHELGLERNAIISVGISRPNNLMTLDF